MSLQSEETSKIVAHNGTTDYAMTALQARAAAQSWRPVDLATLAGYTHVTHAHQLAALESAETLRPAATPAATTAPTPGTTATATASAMAA